jgi:hypothetical protein
MGRVTDAEVKVIASSDIPASLDTAPFIAIANLDVTELLGGAGLSVDRLKNVELYLSAHYALIKTKFVTGEAAGPVNQSFQATADLGLSLTHYGQMAMTLDTSGILSSRNKATFTAGTSSSVTFGWLGSF